jgi:hypothetical protein
VVNVDFSKFIEIETSLLGRIFFVLLEKLTQAQEVKKAKKALVSHFYFHKL